MINQISPETVIPQEFNLDKSLDEMYVEWEKSYVKAQGKLPNKSDISNFNEELNAFKSVVDVKWIEELSEYINSDKPEHRYFAIFVLAWYSVKPIV